MRPKRKRAFWSISLQGIQTNAGGGNVVIDLVPSAGQIMRFDHGRINTAATKTCWVYLVDEDGGVQEVIAYAALNNSALNLPSMALAAADAAGWSGDRAIVPNGDAFQISIQTAANTESILFKGVFELIGSQSQPTISVARSTGTVAAPTETQNEITVVYE